MVGEETTENNSVKGGAYSNPVGLLSRPKDDKYLQTISKAQSVRFCLNSVYTISFIHVVKKGKVF
jgi:hypothetical protein